MSETKKAINSLDMEKVSAILLDVAGTTTAISFVKETLYPYIIKNAEEFLKTSWENDDVKKAIAQFEEKELDASKSAEIVKNLTEKDDSNVGLKTIQGLLLQKGYESGELKGHVFADVLKFLESWSSTKKFAIFSSGSVESQQLLFKNSTEGDLTSHIKKFFDLSVGSKTDSETYKKIAKELEVSPVDVLFLTDDVKEAEAAKSAELNAVLVEREGNSPISEESLANFTVIKSFADISVEKMKRKITEDSVEEPPKKLAKIETVEETKDVNEKKVEENKPEEKNDTENGVEAMEVDEEPVVAEKVAEEKVPTEEEKQPKTEEAPQEEKKEETVESKPEVTEEKPEAMEVDSKEANSKKEETEKSSEQKEVSEEQTNKAETETGTQTKSAVMNECETQTTISIAAVDELPMKEVQDKLMSTETKEPSSEEKMEKEETKTEVKEIEDKKENTETVTETKTEVKEDATEKKEESMEVPVESKETVEAEKESEKTEEVKENNKDVKEDVKEVTEDITEKKEDTKEVKEDVKEVKEDVKEVNEEEKDVKEDVKEVKEVKEEVKEVKEDIKEVKEDVKEVKEDVKEIKENGNVCGKIEVESNGEKEETVEAKEDKETTDEKKECLESNGAQEIHENGVAEGTEKENESQLANGKDSVVPNGEASEATNGTLEKNEDEIKVKKIGDNVESAPVSVEA